MDDVSALPASGPQLDKAIDQAIEHLNKIAVRRNYQAKNWPNHARLWREMLVQSKNRLDRLVAPNLSKSDLSIPAAVKLDGRDWQAFSKWFDRNVAPELLQLSSFTRIPALRAVRRSNTKGGFSESSEAIYCLSFFSLEASENKVSQQQDNAGKTWQGLLNSNSETRSNTGDHLVGITESVSTQRQWRFSISMVLLGIFLLIFCMFLPADSRRIMFIIFSITLLIVGLWGMDKANKEESH